MTRQPAEDSGFGDNSVTRTSIQNNASCNDSGSEAHSGDRWPQTSRGGLHQGTHWKIGRYRPVQPTRDGPASVYDIPVSDHGEVDRLDLVAKY